MYAGLLEPCWKHAILHGQIAQIADGWCDDRCEMLEQPGRKWIQLARLGCRSLQQFDDFCYGGWLETAESRHMPSSDDRWVGSRGGQSYGLDLLSENPSELFGREFVRAAVI